MKRLVAAGCFLIALAGLVLVPATAYACPSAEVNGTITVGHDVVLDVRQVGGNTIIRHVFDGSFTGSLAGTYTQLQTMVVEADGKFNAQGAVTLTGSYDGRSGTITMMINASGDMTTGAVQGHWVILRGTGDLENIHGQGTFGGGAGGATITYSGQVHFGPH